MTHDRGRRVGGGRVKVMTRSVLITRDVFLRRTGDGSQFIASEALLLCTESSSVSFVSSYYDKSTVYKWTEQLLLSFNIIDRVRYIKYNPNIPT